MAININTRDDENNRSIVKPAAKVGNFTLRPISLGSLELLRQIGNTLATGEANPDALDLHTLSQFVWVHAAPLDKVIDTIYNAPGKVAQEVATFCLDVTPADLKGVASALTTDCAAIQAASAVPADSSDEESPNAQTPR